MSGGHFDYNQGYIGRIADDLEQSLKDTSFSPETLAEFRKGYDILRKAYVYAQRIDWLLSDDDGEDNFHTRLKHDLERLKCE
jgi:hypothetical protein